MSSPKSSSLLRAALLSAGPIAPAVAQSIEKVELGQVALSENPAPRRVSGALITRNFAESGLYAARSTMTEGAVFPPHMHSDGRMTQVVDGAMYMGEGETIDESALVAYPAGTVALTPPGTYHYMIAQDGDFTVLEIDTGPSETVFASQ